MNDSPSIAARVGEAVVGLVLGVLYALIATVAHQQVWRLGGIPIPWGLVLALLGVLALVTALRLLFETRWGAVGAAVAVVAVVALLSLPGDSVLVPGNLLGQIWAVAPALIAAVVIAWPNVRVRGRA